MGNRIGRCCRTLFTDLSDRELQLLPLVFQAIERATLFGVFALRESGLKFEPFTRTRVRMDVRLRAVQTTKMPPRLWTVRRDVTVLLTIVARRSLWAHAMDQ